MQQQVIIHNIPQGSEEWHEIRKGKMTGSHAQEIATAGKGLNTYTSKLAMQAFTGKSSKVTKTDAMQRGNDVEYLARVAYELETCNNVYEIGFGELNDYVGSSPDGLVGSDGGVEIKCRDSNEDYFSEIHGKLILGDDTFETKYVWQCHFNMYVFNRQWWDLISFDPSFKDKSLYIERIHRSEPEIEKIIKGLELGKKQIDNKLKMLNNGMDNRI